jgi:DNA (cytosine-5)-methyltransferase 1
VRVLDLFSGIGGFSLGLERAGMRTVAFCEINGYCQRVLKARWPGVPVYDDVCALTGRRLASDGIVADIISGGFPCQDISSAASNRAVGLAGDRSGLWKEYARLIGEVRPQFAIVENSPNLLAGGHGRWFSRVLGDLAALGYDAEWHCIPAAAVGANHIRDRVWIVAYPARERPGQLRWGERAEKSAKARDLRWQEPEPRVGRVADDVSYRVDRLEALGNTVVPLIPELIGEAIMSLPRST